MNPLVSIITLTYNHEKYIGQCIESVTKQTFKDWEMIIIDDGSTDRTGEVIAEYKDPRIHYVLQEHQGLWKIGATYNKALSMARGEYIAILEGDDYWPSYKLGKQIPSLLPPDVVLSYGRGLMINERGKAFNYMDIPHDKSVRYNNPTGQSLRWYLSKGGFITNQTVIIRKSTLLKIGGFVQPDYFPACDYPTYLRLCLEGHFAGLPLCLGVWRRYSNSGALPSWSIFDENAFRYCSEFIQTYQDTIKQLVPYLNLSELTRQNQLRLKKVKRSFLCNEGRFYLALGNYNQARKSFSQSLSIKNDWSTKVFSLFGLVCSILRIDLLQPLHHLKIKLVKYINK